MRRTSKAKGGVSWSTPSKRIEWLVDNKFGGNRSRFAGAVGISHTAVFKVIKGQPPGRRFLEAVSQRLNIPLAWLVDGEGEPGSLPAKEILETSQVLPGSPAEYAELLAAPLFDLPKPTATQYWLRLTSEQPIIQRHTPGFLVSDRLLMETDPSKFHGKERLCNHLCVCNMGEAGVKLGEVSHYPGDVEDGPERLVVDTFDLTTIDEDDLVEEVVYLHHRGQVIRHFTRQRKRVIQGGSVKYELILGFELEPLLPKIAYSDIVGMWTGCLRRHAGHA